MKTKKKFTIFVIILSFLFQMQAQNYKRVSGVPEFEVTAGVLTAYNGAGGNVVIPDNLGITEIGEEAFAGNNNIISVIIPEGVTIIRSVAFVYCGNLSSISLPNSLKTIGFRSFQACSSLSSITIPNSVTLIENWAFSGCSSLTSITIPKSLEYLGIMNFDGCSKLKSINVDVENEIYSSIEGVLYDKKQTILYRYPAGKSGSTFSIPNTVTEISPAAFSGCLDLTSITISSKVVNIRESAFIGCSGLTVITIPNLVETIEARVFEYCDKLSSINVDEGNKVFSSVEGVLFNKDKTVLIRCPEGKTEMAYQIPNSVKIISNRAFLNCRKINSIEMQNMVETIEEYAFANCENIVSFKLSNSTASIGKNAFESCSSLTTLTIPASVKTIGELIFLYCLKLTAIHVDKDNKNYSSTEGVFYNKEKTVLYNYPAGKNEIEFIIPNSVEEISPWACYCSTIKSLVIPKSVKLIGAYAFSNCVFLEDITVYWASPISIPESVFTRWSEGSINLHVPKGSKIAYELFDVWKTLGKIIDDAPVIDNPVSINPELVEKTEAYFYVGWLFINSPFAETVKIYSIYGALLYEFRKPAGKASYKINAGTKNVIIVCGNAGWVKKIII